MPTTGHRARLRPLAGAALAAAVTTAGLVASTTPATAFTVVPDHDADGRLSVPGPMIRAVGDTRDTAAIEVTGLTVWPMDGDDVADGSQQVIVAYTLQRPDGAGGWDNLESGRIFRTVDPGTTADIAPWSFARPSTAMSEEYRVEVLVSWRDSKSYLMGSTAVVPSPFGDAQCATGAGLACETTLNGTVSF